MGHEVRFERARMSRVTRAEGVAEGDIPQRLVPRLPRSPEQQLQVQQIVDDDLLVRAMWAMIWVKV